MTEFEEYLKRRLLEAHVNHVLYGTNDPHEISRIKAEGPKLQGITP